MRLTRALGLAAALGLNACDAGTEERSAVTASRAVMRPSVAVPPGTMPRGAVAAAEALAAPGPAVTPAMITRGEERFLVFCSPCHGGRGQGDGIVVSRGFPPPPSYHEERLRAAPPAHIVGVITHGLGKMSAYADRIPPEDRWAIAHYVKKLQTGELPGADAGVAR